MSNLTNAVDTANNVIDTVQAVIDNPLIGLIGIAFPQVNAILDVARRYSPVIDRAQPIIRAAVEAGEPVFDKVIEQLPQFGKVVAKISALMPAMGDPGKVVENIARSLGGYRRMTFEEEMKWMNDTTPGNDPLQENSRLGSA